MIVELISMPDWWWWLVPFAVGISFGQSESQQRSESQSTGSSRSESGSSSVGGSTGRSLAENASQSGIGFRLRPQLEDTTANFITKMLETPTFKTLFSSDNTVPTLPKLDDLGFYPQQRNLFAEMIRSATAPISAGMASRGMVSPENTANLGAEVARTLAPQLAPLVGQNVRDASTLPGQIMASAASPFAGLIQQLTALLGGTQTGTSTSATDSFFKSLSQALSEASQQSTASGKADASAWNVGLGGGEAGGAAVTALAACWIAESIYGVNAWQTHLLRYWLNQVWEKRSWAGRLVMAAYRRWGRTVAQSVGRYAWLKRLVKPVFDAALRRAVAEVIHA